MAKTINLIVRYNIKKVLPKNMRIARNISDALNKVVQEILQKAAQRVKANKRRTLMVQDL